ncbi:hypothetical protein ABL78_0933 [Leptomonas seymouri]|uniref:Uncharacterized protein n=1 Tax=Leptomonas seymouri TaxID=5684 RepID=A0A0N1I1E2_LEPSE|nr:hypothetical protein ABL78_0933 [Leptomonas seymouri]|eukprot:KPI89965.1 hypothetical protein ABL78_0933 [Leptomonas seymouri]
MSARSTTVGSPLTPGDASASPDVLFKKQVLKLGMDGSSLPRLVVVTESNVYICLPSGGVTRTIAIARIERVTLCPRQDISYEERDSSGDADGAHTPSPSHATEGASSASSLLVSVPSRGGSGGRSSSKNSSRRHSRLYKKDEDETHPSPAQGDTPPAPPQDLGSMFLVGGRRSSTGVSSPKPSAGEWAVVVTLGVAFEAPLALQLRHKEDGTGFVSALRASPQLSQKAVFNMPDEGRPTNALGEPLLSAPPRRADPTVPRVLERDGEGKGAKEIEGDAGVMEEVELSPASRKSTSGEAAVKEDVKGDDSSCQAQGPLLKRRVDETGGQSSDTLHQPERVASYTPSSSSRSSPTPPKASSVHAVEPATAVASSDEHVGRDASKPVALLTPLHEPTPTPRAAAQPVPPLQPQETTKEPPTAATAPTNKFVSMSSGAEPVGHTPSPLRAAPNREAPQPPLQPVTSTAAPSSTSLVTSLNASQHANSDPCRTLQMGDEAVVPAVEKPSDEKPVPTIWEAIRDSEARSSQLPLPALPKVECHTQGGRSSWMVTDPAELHPLLAPAAPVSQHLPPPVAPSSVTTEDFFHERRPADAQSSPAVLTPAHREPLHAELAGLPETAARLHRSLQAQEALLLEVRSLRATLAERDAQCAEWQAAYTHAEEHIGSLQREQEHLLAEQGEWLRCAHRKELEAVQAAFEEYDTRMTDFLGHLQREHREEAAQWQHERRTLHHQLEELLHQQEDGKQRARAVAEAAVLEARQRRAQSPSLYPTPLSCLDHSLGSAADVRTSPAESVDAYENTRVRVQEKMEVYVAQRQRHKQATSCPPTPPAPSSFVPSPSPGPRGNRGSSSAVAAPRASPPQQTPASPWPQPRSATETAPSSSSSPRIALGAHRLFDSRNNEDHEGMQSVAHPMATPPLRRRDPRGSSLIQTPPPPSSTKDCGREHVEPNNTSYNPHRRTFL